MLWGIATWCSSDAFSPLLCKTDCTQLTCLSSEPRVALLPVTCQHLGGSSSSEVEAGEGSGPVLSSASGARHCRR